LDTVAFIGGEFSATGFRLAGATVYIVPAGEATDALRTARASAALVLVAATHAAGIARDELEQALAASRPLTLVVEDILARATPPDLEHLMRRALGVEIA
jgi:vacuolar-type H+-ATPase subunit F/Vma7